MHNFRIGLLATGNELTEGDILNTNGQIIAQQLVEHGFVVGLHLISTDADEDIKSALNFLLSRHDIVIIIGGLGPTSDDRTRYALSAVIGQDLLFDDHTWQQLLLRYERIKFNPRPENRQQALFPKDAIIIPNLNGTAAGCSVLYNNKIIYMLPGPPNECLPMFKMSILPQLLSKKTAQHYKFKWLLLGVIESEIAALLDEAVKNYAVTTGYRIAYPYLEVKLYGSNENTITLAAAEIKKIIAPYLMSNTNKTATQLLNQALSQFSGLITITDEVTGGHLQAALLTPEVYTKIKFGVHFNNKNQEGLLIAINGLTEYWQGHMLAGTTQIQLVFTKDNIREEKFIKLPVRNTFVIKYAVEYIAYSILEYLSHHKLVDGSEYAST